MGDGLFSGQYNTIGQGGGHGDGIGTQPGSDYIYEELENSETKKTRSQSKVEEGPIIASWYFQGSQVKGEAKRDFTEVLQAARDEAAEAVSENEIPRKYEEPIKKYFGGLEQSGTEWEIFQFSDMHIKTKTVSLSLSFIFNLFSFIPGKE